RNTPQFYAWLIGESATYVGFATWDPDRHTFHVSANRCFHVPLSAAPKLTSELDKWIRNQTETLQLWEHGDQLSELGFIGSLRSRSDIPKELASIRNIRSIKFLSFSAEYNFRDGVYEWVKRHSEAGVPTEFVLIDPNSRFVSLRNFEHSELGLVGLK